MQKAAFIFFVLFTTVSVVPSVLKLSDPNGISVIFSFDEEKSPSKSKEKKDQTRESETELFLFEISGYASPQFIMKSIEKTGSLPSPFLPFNTPPPDFT
ncbi:MAG TPA: hypothetical protein PKC72_00160 [Chitinophagaceae bacterium]|nr:hypothetical protein [Chitinophagaceae bacterium]